MNLQFTQLAQEEYKEIIVYLNEKFNIKKAELFERQFKAHLNQLLLFPESFPFLFDTKQRKFMVNAYITVVYDLNKENEIITILTFWFNQNNPDDLLRQLGQVL